MGLSIHSTTLMGFRTHRTHTYGAQQPQDPHLWGSAPPAPWGGHHPIGRLAALPHRGSLPHGGDGGLHPTPPLLAPQRPPPHGPPPSPPHRLRPQRTPNRPPHPTERDPKGPPHRWGAWPQRMGVASGFVGGAPTAARVSQWAWHREVGVASRNGRGLNGGTAPKGAWPQSRRGSANVGLCPISAPKWGSAP